MRKYARKAGVEPGMRLLTLTSIVIFRSILWRK